MGLFDIFKKKKKADLKTNTTTRQQLDSKQEDYDKSREILKQATSFKSDDINKAIALIKQAIKVSPEHNMTDYFKLANYYHISGNAVKAYSIYQDQLDNLDINDIGMYNMDRSQVFQKLCTFSYKEKKYSQYLKHYCFWLYNTTVAFACQGRKEELNSIIGNRNKLDYLAAKKVNGSFKKLGKELSKEEFNDKLIEFFDNQKVALTQMAKAAHEIDRPFHPEKGVPGESRGQRSNRLLKEQENFMSAYHSFNTEQFDKYYKTTLQPIIEI